MKVICRSAALPAGGGLLRTRVVLRSVGVIEGQRILATHWESCKDNGTWFTHTGTYHHVNVGAGQSDGELVAYRDFLERCEKLGVSPIPPEEEL